MNDTYIVRSIFFIDDLSYIKIAAVSLIMEITKGPDSLPNSSRSLLSVNGSFRNLASSGAIARL